MCDRLVYHDNFFIKDNYTDGFKAFYIIDIFIRGKLATLIRAYDLRTTVFVYCHSQSINNPFSFHSVRQTPARDASAIYIHNGQKIHVTPFHRNVRDIRRPYMVGLVDFQITKQTGIFISGRINDGSARPSIDRL